MSSAQSRPIDPHGEELPCGARDRDRALDDLQALSTFPHGGGDERKKAPAGSRSRSSTPINNEGENEALSSSNGPTKTAASSRASKTRSSSVSSQRDAQSPVHMTRGAARRMSQGSPEVTAPGRNLPPPPLVSAVEAARRPSSGETRMMGGRSQQGGGREKVTDGPGSLQKATGGQKRRISSDQAAAEPSRTRRRRSSTTGKDLANANLSVAVPWQKQMMQQGWNSLPSAQQHLARASAFSLASGGGGGGGGGGKEDLPQEVMETLKNVNLSGDQFQMLLTLQEFGIPKERAKELLPRDGETGPSSQSHTGRIGGLSAPPSSLTNQMPPWRTDGISTFSQRAGGFQPRQRQHFQRNDSTGESGPKKTRDDSSLECEVCHRRFVAASGLGKHRLTHNDDKKYSCPICSKTFRRHDHMTNHLLTHRERKPFKCSTGECQKSYCDLRSLKRHVESHHGPWTADESLKGRMMENGSGDGSNADVTQMSRDEKKASLQIDYGSDVVDSEGKHRESEGTPTVTPPPPSLALPPPPPLSKNPRLDSAVASSFQAPSYGNPSLFPVRYGTPQQQQQQEAMSLPPPPYPFGSDAGVRPEYMFQPAAAAAVAAAAASNSSSNMAQSWQYLAALSAVYGQMPYFPYGGFLPSMAPSMGPVVSTTAAAAVATASVTHPIPTTAYSVSNTLPASKKEKVSSSTGKSESTKHQGKNGPKSTGSYNQVQCPICERYFKNVKSLNGHLRLHGGYEGASKAASQESATQKREREKSKQSSASAVAGASPQPTAFQTLLQAIEVTKRKEEERSSGGGGSIPALHDSPPVKRRRPGVHFRNSPEILNRSPRGGNGLQFSSDDLFCESPSPTGSDTSRRRKRPQNLTLTPDKAFNDDDDDYYPKHTAPPPYTPPPMLSPRITMSGSASPLKSPRISILNTPIPTTPRSVMTPGSGKFNLPWFPRRISTGEGGIEEQITLTPKINVGSEFQAEVPSFIGEESKPSAERKATQVWSPSMEVNQEDLVEIYLDLACSNLVRYCGQNKEYALHVLYLHKGDVVASVKALLSGSSMMKEGHPLMDYHYSGSTRWTRPERQKFRQAWRLYGKQFPLISIALNGSKKVSDVIEYYYRWKKYCNTEYRGRTRHDSDDYNSEEETSYAGPPFECEYPDCGASFATRQSLNGHIRVHGGNFVYKMETRRSRSRGGNGGGANEKCQYNVSPVTANIPSAAPAAVDDESPFPPLPPPHASASGHFPFVNTSEAVMQLPSLMQIPFLGHQSVMPSPSLPPSVQFSTTAANAKMFIQPFSSSVAPTLPSTGGSGKGGGRRSGAGAGRGTNAGDGKLEFKCKVCGRVFSKVKSRSAHMKIHSSRSDNF
eukprot:m.13800 g.13800  ORF g.13800 m.13800 type:complete len:1353 (+) comp25231_c1_seq2:197-4255(+)